MTSPPADQPADAQPWSTEARRAVGRQGNDLGGSVSIAFRTALESEENRRSVKPMQEGLETMVGKVSAAMLQTAASSEAQQVTERAHKAAESARAAGEKAFHEAQPHLLSALRQVDAELRKMIDRLEQVKPLEEGPTSGSAS